MSQRLHNYFKLFFLFTLVFVLISACYGRTPQNTLNPKAKLTASECRLVQHKLGETCVPLNPQRLITMDETTLEAVIALGLKPTAAGEANWVASRGKQFGKKTQGIISLGEESQPNLERIVKLNPDLILGLSISPENYRIFSQIAPTVTFDYIADGWKDSFLKIGEVFGKTIQAKEILAQYENRVKEFQEAMEKRLNKTEVTISRFYNAHSLTEFRTSFSFPGSVLSELGFSFPKRQIQLIKNDLPLIQISLERIDLLDADFLFVALDPGSEKNFKRYQKSQLWQQLNVVQNNQVYVVSSGYWIFGNILSANTILDDLNKYLMQENYPKS
jgi:iron complex transport system substrate-binding protein